MALTRQRNNLFTKENSLIVKGLATLMLLSHHLFFGQIATPIHWFGGDSLTQIFATIFKVCVTLFAIISGYGLTESYRNKNSQQSDCNFVYEKTKNLMKQYWFMFFLFVPLGFILGHNPVNVYGTGMRGIFFFLIDACGLFPIVSSPTMNYTWWYIEAALFFYLLFPLIYKIMKKHPWFLLVPTYILFAKYGAAYCREIFWLCPFCVGIYCSEKNVFNTYIRKFDNANEDDKTFKRIKITFWTIAWLIARSKIGIAVDIFFALTIIKFSYANIMNRKILKQSLKFIGTHSANIFFTHSFIYYYYSVIATPFNLIPYKWLQYIVLLTGSLLLSLLIEFLKKQVSKPFILNVQMAKNTI